jgi:hypothetical protein
MKERGTRGAYRKEDRVQLPPELQKELVEKAAARYGNCQELAKHLNIPKSSVHYYRIGRLTMPVSVLGRMLDLSNDASLRDRIEKRGITKDRSWATEYAQDVFREMCRDKLTLPTRDELEADHNLRRKAAAIISYVLAEGSVWLQKEEFGEHAANITFADHERDFYDHFRFLCREVFSYDIGPPQMPGNGAKAIRGFIYSRFVAEWLVYNGVPIGDKAANPSHLPEWVMKSTDALTWISALQPWCDGEGCVRMDSRGNATGFSISQSRHSMLDFENLSHRLCRRGPGRMLGLGQIRDSDVYGIPLLFICLATCRSEVIDDVLELLTRLEFHPRLGVHSLYLKDDGFWSCNWWITLPKRDIHRLARMRLVTQREKVSRILNRPTYI